jgi:hypothetical protein
MADPLSAADREALLGEVVKVNGQVAGRTDARYRAAIEAYRSAMMDEGAALELYFRCIERTNFLDQGKKPLEFREWKKREDERTSEVTMRRALMHQLHWLVLALRASSERADLDQLTREGMEAIDSLFNDQATLASQKQILGQGVIGTVFAKMYGITDVKLDKWPATPLDIPSFYEQLVFPRLRTAGDVAKLQAAWLKRIQQEGVLNQGGPVAKSKANGRGGPSPAADSSLARERFLTEVLPDLQWQMEMDLFRCGDQSGAAKRMLDHLNRHLTDRKITSWTDQFKDLLTAPNAPARRATPAAEAAAR